MDHIASVKNTFDAALADVEAAVAKVEGYVNSGFSALQAENAALKAKNAALKAKLDDYEVRIGAMIFKLKAILQPRHWG